MAFKMGGIFLFIGRVLLGGRGVSTLYFMRREGLMGSISSRC